MKQRNGVLGLETARAVFVAFLILAITGVAILLSLTALDNAVGSTVDDINRDISVANETGSWINTTTYTLAQWNSTFTSVTLTELWNATDNSSIGLGNVTFTESTGSWVNATTTNWANVMVSYTGVYTEDRGRMDNIVGNVSGGLETFFGSTGTVFSILIVIVIILTISIIIWAVGRFGQRTEGEMMQGEGTVFNA